MSLSSPVIGVTGPDKGGSASWLFVSSAIRRAGGVPRRLTPSRFDSLANIQGVVLGGGADVDPALYGEVREPVWCHRMKGESVGNFLAEFTIGPIVRLSRAFAGKFTGSYIDSRRDRMELDVLTAAVDAKLPILAICRGQQLVNVFFGGNLYQILSGFYVEEPELITITPRKRIFVIERSLLARIMGSGERLVNGLHRQGINRIGQHLSIVARDVNGIVQAIEHTSLPFLIGVQWHPEYIPHLREQRELFRALVAYAAGEGERYLHQRSSSAPTQEMA